MLIERMNTSDGPAKVQLAYGRSRFGHGETTNDLVYLFRTNYPELFEKRESHLNSARNFSEKQLGQMKSLDGLFDMLLLGNK